MNLLAFFLFQLSKCLVGLMGPLFCEASWWQWGCDLRIYAPLSKKIDQLNVIHRLPMDCVLYFLLWGILDVPLSKNMEMERWVWRSWCGIHLLCIWLSFERGIRSHEVRIIFYEMHWCTASNCFVDVRILLLCNRLSFERGIRNHEVRIIFLWDALGWPPHLMSFVSCCRPNGHVF